MIARVLVAEDDDGVRRALTTTLTRSGFDVVAVDDGAPAIALATTHVFEIVLVDLNMKVVGGIDVARFYKQRYGTNIYCIVLSGDDDAEMRTSCAEAGVDDVIMKPTSPSELRRRLLSFAKRSRAA